MNHSTYLRHLIIAAYLVLWTVPSMAVVQGNPQISLSTNQSSFIPGDFLTLNIDIQQGTQNNLIDGWVGVVLPDGALAFLQSDLMTFSSTPAPTIQNFMVIDFSGPLFQLQIPSVLPTGTYTFLAVGVIPGTDPFQETNHVTNVASAAVTLQPPPVACANIAGFWSGIWSETYCDGEPDSGIWSGIIKKDCSVVGGSDWSTVFGTVSENVLTAAGNDPFCGTINITGTISDNTISGTYTYSKGGSGTFLGSKQ